jgi:hypothetical protein
MGAHLCELGLERYNFGIGCDRGCPRPFKDLSSLPIASLGFPLSFGARLGGTTSTLERLTLIVGHGRQPLGSLPTPFGECSDLAITSGAVVFGQHHPVPILSRGR